MIDRLSYNPDSGLSTAQSCPYFDLSTSIADRGAGFSYMSIAWATVASSATGRLESWRGVLAFGGYNGASCVIDRIYASMPQLVLGHMLPHSAVGLSNSGVRGVRHPEAKSF